VRVRMLWQHLRALQAVSHSGIGAVAWSHRAPALVIHISSLAKRRPEMHH
jgi:hypothetical protein